MPGKAKQANTKYGFGKTSSAARGVELKLPSKNARGDHNVVLVRVPNPQTLLAAGVLDSFDSLTALVKTEHFDRIDIAQSADPEAAMAKIAAGVSKLAESKEALLDGLGMVDKIVAHCVLEPAVYLAPPEGEEWTPEQVDALESGAAVFVGDVDLDDKMFIMQYEVGGTTDLEEFRKGTGQLMGSVEGGSDVPRPAKRVPARRSSSSGTVSGSGGPGVRKSTGGRAKSGRG